MAAKQQETKKRHRKPVKRGLGRPKKSFTDEEIAQMSKYAFEGCQNTTIANLMDISIDTLQLHFKTLLCKKRCERKLRLRQQQNKAAKGGNPALLIFLGKNYLDQTDKRDITSGGEQIGAPTMVVVKPEGTDARKK